MEHFEKIVWCKQLLVKPGNVVFTPTSLTPPDESGNRRSQDQLFYKTLRHEDAIPHSIGVYEDTPSDVTGGKRFLIRSSSLLFELRPGLKGFNGIVHGGFIGALVDEAMGNLISVNAIANMRAGVDLPGDVYDLSAVALFTVGITMRYKKALKTPSIVQVKSELIKIDGRKVSFKTVILDSDGSECVQSEGMWVGVPRQKL